MVKENKDIKRKSAAFLSRAGEDLVRQFELSLEDDEEEETENGVDPQQVKELNARMEGKHLETTCKPHQRNTTTS